MSAKSGSESAWRGWENTGKGEMKKQHHHQEEMSYGSMGNGVGAIFILAVVFFFVILLFLWLIKPNFILKKDSTEIDIGKLVLWSVLGALAVMLLIWFAKSLSRGRW